MCKSTTVDINVTTEATFDWSVGRVGKKEANFKLPPFQQISNIFRQIFIRHVVVAISRSHWCFTKLDICIPNYLFEYLNSNEELFSNEVRDIIGFISLKYH